jgi:hypothetical protein
MQNQTTLIDMYWEKGERGIMHVRPFTHCNKENTLQFF